MPVFTAEVRRLLDRGVRCVEVNTSRATFADSAALVALVRAGEHAEAVGAELWLTETSGPGS